MLVQLTPPQAPSTQSPAQQVATLIGAQISQSAYQLQEIIGKAASVVSATVSTTTSTPVGAMLHIGAAVIADTAINMANKEVDRALNAVTDPLGAGASMLRDKIGSEVSHQAQSVEKNLKSAAGDTDPTTPSADGKTPFLAEPVERYESPKSFGEILFGKGRKTHAEPETLDPAPQRRSLVGDTLGLPAKRSLTPSLAS
ncbi:MAG: hypothetical protein RL326_2025 [Pseudomonadota bacterium]|jgi:hypothetical protein